MQFKHFSYLGEGLFKETGPVVQTDIRILRSFSYISIEVFSL